MASNAEDLRDRVLSLFADNMESDANLNALWEAIHSGKKASYIDAYDFAVQTGEKLSEAFSAVQSDIPESIDYDFANTLMSGPLRQDYTLVSDASAAVQQTLNEEAGLGLKAQTAPLNGDRINGLVEKFAGYEKAPDGLWLLDEPVKTFSQSVVDDTIRKNAEFQSKAGLRPRIIRTLAGESCKWCQDLAGVYDYPDNVPKDVYRRHENCRCTVDYDPGYGKRVQNVWTKRWTQPDTSVIVNSSSATAPSDPVEIALQLKKGAPMDSHTAVTGANPNYAQGWEYQYNCQRCVQAYELRRRGYAVVAAPRPRTGNTVAWGSECFIPAGQNAMDAYTMSKTDTEIKDMVKSGPDGARYSIYVAWKNSTDAHVFIAEKENGIVKYIDPQSGSEDCSSYFADGKEGRFGYFRLDDKQITSDLSIIRNTVEG